MIYYVEDEKNIRELVEYALLANGFEIKCFSEGRLFGRNCERCQTGVDPFGYHAAGGENGLEILHRLKN